MAIEYSGESFSGYNKPKRTPSHPKKSHAVLAKVGNLVRLIRFGQQGVSGAGKNPKTDAQKARRRSFKARHAKNIAKGRMSAAYWADKVKWNDADDLFDAEDKVLELYGRVESIQLAKSRVNESGNYTKPSMRKRIFERIKAGGKGGKAGQWSARKAQMLTKQYESAGGGYKGKKSAPKKSQQSLKTWTKQKWRTKSGKPSTQGPEASGERYLPSSVIDSMSSAQYAATTKKKRRDTKAGKQYSRQPKSRG